jgi:hypothetical protein
MMPHKIDNFILYYLIDLYLFLFLLIIQNNLNILNKISNFYYIYLRIIYLNYLFFPTFYCFTFLFYFIFHLIFYILIIFNLFIIFYLLIISYIFIVSNLFNIFILFILIIPFIFILLYMIIIYLNHFFFQFYIYKI